MHHRSADKSVDEFFNNDLDSDEEEPESDNEDFAGIDTIVEEDDGSDMDVPTPKKLTAAQKEKQAAKEEAANKIQLDALKEKDPEFYKYLQENDQELLDFDGEMEDVVARKRTRMSRMMRTRTRTCREATRKWKNPNQR